MAKKSKKRKGNKFKRISFHLTVRQKESLDKNCKIRKTTPIKLIKRSIDHYLSLQVEEKPIQYHAPNQLNLFDEQ